VPYVVDTVALVRFLEDSPDLGARAGEILADPDVELVIPAIVLSEAQYLFARRGIPLNFGVIVEAVLSDPRCAVYPIDVDVVMATPPPPALEMHDALVYATASVVASKLNVPLSSVPILTSDRRLRAFGAPIAW
jgi:predicted nucleic acid-binding protein